MGSLSPQVPPVASPVHPMPPRVKSLGSIDLQQSSDPEYSIRTRFKRATILTITSVLVLITATIMYLCANDGLRLNTFESRTKDNSTRKQLLDAYNSYSGSVVSLVTKVLEVFLAMVAALGVLCFATGLSASSGTSQARESLQPRALGDQCRSRLLLTNGFNALNVQLPSRPVESEVSASVDNGATTLFLHLD